MSRLLRLTATNAAAFDAAISAHAGKGVTVLALFTGDKDDSGHSWCPDCNDAQPVIDAALARSPVESIVLITVPLPRSEYKGNPSHWAR